MIIHFSFKFRILVILKNTLWDEKDLSCSKINFSPTLVIVSVLRIKAPSSPPMLLLFCVMTFSSNPLLISDSLILFSIRLVDTFKLHEQLNVPVQKLTAGATRKVRVVCEVILRADVVVATKGGVSLHFSCVLCWASWEIHQSCFWMNHLQAWIQQDNRGCGENYKPEAQRILHKSCILKLTSENPIHCSPS